MTIDEIFVLDVQGFKADNNQFIFKEVAVLPLRNDALVKTYLFKPPFKWSDLGNGYKTQNRWLFRNYHGLIWNIGNLPYTCLHDVLNEVLSTARLICVKGNEKKCVLEKLLPNHEIVNIEEFGCPSLQKLKEKVSTAIMCSHHVPLTQLANCAKKNVLVLKEWLVQLQ